ncbi:hypothetical protein B0H11DRAFT_437133 [Mycena galericulata]|nr:hypothetical protein B0H11DRAFT_437133 [Mycena galericulata]
MKEKYKRVKNQRADWKRAYNELAESNAQSTQIPDDVEEDDEIMEIDGDNVPENSEGLRAEVASLETSLSELKEKYKRVKSEKTDWKRAYREVADSLREESSTNAPSTRMPDDQEADDESSEDDGEVDTDDGDEDTDGTPDDIEENDESSEDGEEDADEEPATFENAAAETSVTGPPTMSAYRQHMTSQLLPVVVDRSKFSDLAIDKGLGFNLHSYLGQSQGSWIFLNHILYLPGRLVELSGLDLLVAFGPTNRYNRQSQKWVEGSDLAILDGATREVFMAKNKQIIYAGSYKCHDLSPVNPEGVNRPGSVSGSEIIDAALGIPRPSNYKEIIRKHFPDGNITIEAVGLRCVGFNHQLYESLRQRFEALDAKKKRKAEKQNEKGKGTKRRKVKGNN